MSDESKVVQLEDVKAFLEEGKTATLDLDTEQVQPLLKTQVKEEAEQKKADTPLREELEPDADTLANRAVWSMELPGTVKVEASDMDRNLFLKAALNDTPVKLEVILPSLPDTPIVCRTLSDKETSVIFTALDADMLEKTVNSDGSFRSQLQAYSTYLQVLTFDGKAYKYHTSIDSTASVSDSAAALRKHHANVQENLHAPQYSLALAALRVFTVKVKLCTDNLLNANFWKPLEADSE
jgi:hypothetical protein